jgi:ABC-type transport system involved in multi-copper enzyme maturation permease subunit
VIDHLRADAIRLGSRWDVRAFLLLVPVLAIGGYLASFATIESHYGWDPSQPMPTEIAAMIASDRAGYAFPASILTVFGNAPWLLFAVFFIASGTTGLEFGWATIKTALISSPSRGRLALSRMVSVGVIGLVALVLTGLVGLVMPGVMPFLGQQLPASRPTEPQVIAGTMAALVLSAADFAALGVLLGVVTRGPALPLLIVLVDFIVEGMISGLPIVREAGLQLLAGSLPVLSVVNLVSRAQDPTAYGLPVVPTLDGGGTNALVADRPLDLSFVVVAAWTLAFVLLAQRQLRRADILE